MRPLPFRLRLRSRLLVAAALLLGMCAPSASAFDTGFNDTGLQYYAGFNGAKPNDAALAAGLQHARAAGATTFRVMCCGARWPAERRPPPPPTRSPPTRRGAPTAGTTSIGCSSSQRRGTHALVWFQNAPPWAEGPVARRRASRTRPAPGSLTRQVRAVHEGLRQALQWRLPGSEPARPPAAAREPLSGVERAEHPVQPHAAVERSRGKWVNPTPAIYRKLQNAAYRGITSQNPGATVLSAATAPFGGLTRSDPRIAPPRSSGARCCACRRDEASSRPSAPARS